MPKSALPKQKKEVFKMVRKENITTTRFILNEDQIKILQQAYTILCECYQLAENNTYADSDLNKLTSIFYDTFEGNDSCDSHYIMVDEKNNRVCIEY